MSESVFLISIRGRDESGLIATVTASLFDVGVSLADAHFSVLGSGFEFGALAEAASGVSEQDIVSALASVEQLAAADVSVTPAPYPDHRERDDDATHIIQFSGGDRPGLVARMSEVFQHFNANVLRMTSTRRRERTGAVYITEFAVYVPAGVEGALESTLYNTAGSLRLDCSMDRLVVTEQA